MLKAETSQRSSVRYEICDHFFLRFIYHLGHVSVTFVCGRQRKGDRVQHNRLAVASCKQLLCAEA